MSMKFILALGLLLTSFTAQSEVIDLSEIALTSDRNHSPIRINAPIDAHNDPYNLLGYEAKLRTLDETESLGLMSASSDLKPWSDFYWAFYTGGLAYRYRSNDFTGAANDTRMNNCQGQDAYLCYRNYYSRFNSNTMLDFEDENAIDMLSPSEKYELLVGDKNFSITNAMWSTGDYYHRTSGTVERWMGACEGTSAAASVLPAPTDTVRVTAADGTKINFYPQDIRALISYTFSGDRADYRAIGRRCNTKDPATDSAGRISDVACFDTNPASLHLALTNVIGLDKQNLVIDSNYDYEVWNYAVFDYSYRYFNPQTRYYADSLETAGVTRRDYYDDPYQAYRGDYDYVVGIEMKAKYAAGIQPSRATYMGPGSDKVTEVTYYYDLEIKNGRIVGGEWYSKVRPDFVWKLVDGKLPYTAYDQQISTEWNDFSRPIPQDWQQAARNAFAGSNTTTRPQTVLTVVKRLLDASRGEVSPAPSPEPAPEPVPIPQ